MKILLEKQIEAAKLEGVKAIGQLLLQMGKQNAKIAELVEQDLANEGMGIEKCYEALYAHAKKHQKGGCWACPVFEISPKNEAVQVILDFYHIPYEWLDGCEAQPEAQAVGRVATGAVDLMDLL